MDDLCIVVFVVTVNEVKQMESKTYRVEALVAVRKTGEHIVFSRDLDCSCRDCRNQAIESIIAQAEIANALENCLERTTTSSFLRNEKNELRRTLEQ